jgi:aminopeptidase N
MAPLPGAPARVRALTRHPDFTAANPNRLRALIGSFAQANPVGFHDASGDGYALLAETIAAVDPANPQVAARLASAFGMWRRMPPARRTLMAAALAELAGRPDLSANSREVITKMLTPSPSAGGVTRH